MAIHRPPSALAPANTPSDPPMAIVDILPELAALRAPLALPMQIAARLTAFGPTPPAVPDALPISTPESDCASAATPMAMVRIPSAVAPVKTPSDPPIPIAATEFEDAPAMALFALPITIAFVAPPVVLGPVPPAVPEALPTAILKMPVEEAFVPSAMALFPAAAAPLAEAASAPPIAIALIPVADAPALVPFALPMAIALSAVAVGAAPVLVESLLPSTMVRKAVALALSPIAILSVPVATASSPMAIT